MPRRCLQAHGCRGWRSGPPREPVCAHHDAVHCRGGREKDKMCDPVTLLRTWICLPRENGLHSLSVSPRSKTVAGQMPESRRFGLSCSHAASFQLGCLVVLSTSPLLTSSFRRAVFFFLLFFHGWVSLSIWRLSAPLCFSSCSFLSVPEPSSLK